MFYDVHNTDPEEKEFNISKISRFPWNRIVKELENYVLLCANCHRLVHSSDSK
jgi:predicted HNH restriction endonuclease